MTLTLAVTARFIPLAVLMLARVRNADRYEKHSAELQAGARRPVPGWELLRKIQESAHT